MTTISFDTMSDRELLECTVRVACDERHLTADLLALLGECDARRLYLGEGCSSLFTYCTQVLHLSEHAAYHRIEAARAARQFPIILELVADGSVTLTTVAMLRSHLTADNHGELLAGARHRTKREVEHQIACLAPTSDVKALIRRLPTPVPLASAVASAAPAARPVASARVLDDLLSDANPLIPSGSIPLAISLAGNPAATSPRTTVSTLAADRYLLRITLSAEAHTRLRRAQELMGHSVPNGDPALIIDKALSLLVDQLERARLAKVRRPRAGATRTSASTDGTRHIPAAMRRQAWTRDEGRCAFIGSHGRCTETSRLEFHHIVPFARGGPTTIENLALRCRSHNTYESERAFGSQAERRGRMTQAELLEGHR